MSQSQSRRDALWQCLKGVSAKKSKSPCHPGKLRSMCARACALNLCNHAQSSAPCALAKSSWQHGAMQPDCSVIQAGMLGHLVRVIPQQEAAEVAGLSSTEEAVWRSRRPEGQCPLGAGTGHCLMRSQAIPVAPAHQIMACRQHA